jgi:hypothetical protein
MYAQILDDSTFVDLYSLPSLWEGADGSTILNFHLLDPQEIINIGKIYPLEIINGTYDTTQFTQGEPEYLVLEDRIIKTFSLIPIPVPELFATMKANKATYIYDSFTEAFLKGYYCPTVGIKLDSRPSDLANMQMLLLKFTRSQVKIDKIVDPTIQAGAQAQLDASIDALMIKDFNNEFHHIDLVGLDNLIGDLIDYGLYLYQHKWALQDAVNNATTIAELNNIRW